VSILFLANNLRKVVNCNRRQASGADIRICLLIVLRRV
jgi:hypothetical protein